MNMLLLTIKLICLDSISVNDSSTTIYFNQGQSYYIDSDFKNYAYASTLIKRSFQRQHPIAVSIQEDNKLVEILRADNDFVVDIETIDNNRNQIHFQGHDGRYFVDSQNKNYEALLKKISKCIHNKERIWFVTAAPELTVYDVLPEGELKKMYKK